MTIKEQDIVLVTEDSSGNKVIQMPVTRIENVEGGVATVNGVAPDSDKNVQITKVDRATAADSADSVLWSRVTNKPTTAAGYGITFASTAQAEAGTATDVPMSPAATKAAILKLAQTNIDMSEYVTSADLAAVSNTLVKTVNGIAPVEGNVDVSGSFVRTDGSKMTGELQLACGGIGGWDYPNPSGLVDHETYLYTGTGQLSDSTLVLRSRTSEENPSSFSIRAGGIGGKQLSGYAETGTLNWNGQNFQLEGYPTIVSTRSDDDAYIGTYVYGGRDGNSSGARLILRPKESPKESGAFQIQAHDGANSNVLGGYPSGALTWGGKNIARSWNGASADANGDIIATRITANNGVNKNIDFTVYGATNGCCAYIDGDYLNGLAANQWKRIYLQGESPSYNWVFASGFKATSDRRKKDNLERISPDFSEVHAYRYTFKPDGLKHVGLIAQDVQKVLPEAVSEDEDGYLTIDYNSVVAALVDKVNALEAEVKALKDRE